MIRRNCLEVTYAKLRGRTVIGFARRALVSLKATHAPAHVYDGQPAYSVSRLQASQALLTQLNAQNRLPRVATAVTERAQCRGQRVLHPTSWPRSDPQQPRALPKEPCLDVSRTVFVDFDELHAAPPTRTKPDPRCWHSEMPRDGSDDRGIGCAIDWRSGYPHV